MGDTLQVSIDASKDVAEPTLEELAAKYDEAAPPAEDRPEWLPEKFKDPSELAKAYAELEKKLGSSSKEPLEATEKTTEADPELEGTKDTPDAEEAAREAADKAGLDFDTLSQKYFEKGSIEDSDYAALEKAGIPKSLVDQFIAGQEALLTATRNSVFSAVGGESQYSELTEWAADNFSKQEIDAFNKAVNSGDLNMTMMAVKGLQARYKAEVGFEPTRQVRGETARAGSHAYRSIAEMEKDMSDPRYKSDPAFRKDVERKLANSDIM